MIVRQPVGKEIQRRTGLLKCGPEKDGEEKENRDDRNTLSFDARPLSLDEDPDEVNDRHQQDDCSQSLAQAGYRNIEVPGHVQNQNQRDHGNQPPGSLHELELMPRAWPMVSASSSTCWRTEAGS